MSENRKCVNCRHNIRKEKPSGNIECVCEITNEHIGYVKCFDGWCRHWAKQKDGKEAKFLILDDLHDTKVADFSKLEGIGKQWYEHCVGRSNFTVLGGTVMSKGDLDKFTKKEQTDD